MTSGRELDDWEPWADHSHAPGPSTDPDEDQSAVDGPRRGSPARRPAKASRQPGSRSSARSRFGSGGAAGGSGRRTGSGPPARRSWGVQMDADVEEPVPAAPPTVEEVLAAEEALEEQRRQRADRPAGRGRAGSFARPRRPAGEPAPPMEDPEAVARQLCLSALTGSARTRQQLADLLRDRDVPEDAAAAVLDRFVEVGLIDDAAFASAWVDSRQRGRGLSKRALAQELRAKGVDAEVAAVALEAVDAQDEWDTARALVARKVPSMRRLDTATATRRLIGMLARKGYGGGLAAIVVREALEADGAAEDAAADAED